MLSETIRCSALLDSGADRTIIPEVIADVLNLKKGSAIETAGIDGLAKGYDSRIDLSFVDINNKVEFVNEVPVYVLSNFNDVVIGRKKVFDFFRVIFEKFNNKILLIPVSKTPL